MQGYSVSLKEKIITSKKNKDAYDEIIFHGKTKTIVEFKQKYYLYMKMANFEI